MLCSKTSVKKTINYMMVHSNGRGVIFDARIRER